MRSSGVGGATLLATVLATVMALSASAQTRRLLAGGGRSLFAVADLSLDDEPFRTQLRSGGNLDVRSMDLGPGCVGFAMERPDVIVHLRETAARLAFSVRANGGDTTLVVHTPDGRWLCNDDGPSGSDPRIDIESPASGQYDVWVGSYRADQHLRATLRARARR